MGVTPTVPQPTAPPKMSVQDFAAKIKEKYPSYASVGDSDLVQKIVAKYPQYQSQVDLNAKPAAGGTVSAAPKEGWLDQAEHDLRQGGTRTVVGRGLGELQGRGSKGYTGLESGVSKGAAEFMGSPELGVVHAAQGIAEIPKHPVKGVAKAVGGVLEAGTIPLSMVNPMEGASNKVADFIPTTENAAKLLNQVKADAGAVEVNLSRSKAELFRAKELADAAGKMPSGLNKFLKRVTGPTVDQLSKGKPVSKPLTYNEARDIYTNITQLSADDKLKMSPVMKRQVALLAKALKADIGDAAEQVGQGAKYYAGMKEYSKAKKLADAAVKMREFFAKPLVKGISEGVGLGAGGALGYEAYQHFSR